jgi:hypothetical protein
MPKEILELAPHHIEAFLAQGKDMEYIKRLDDVLYVHKWAIENMQDLEIRRWTNIKIFSVNDLHKSGRFKNSKKTRVDTALQTLVEWQVLDEPFKQENGKGRPAILCHVNPYWLPDADHTIEQLHEGWINWLLAEDAPQEKGEKGGTANA